MPESDARSVSAAQTPSGTGLLHPSFNHCLFNYAIGSRKLLANEQFFFVGAQTVMSLLQTAQIKQGVSFIAVNKVYTSTNPQSFESKRNSFFNFFYPGWIRLVSTSVLWR